MTEGHKQSFWNTVPGILTGVAALITAIGGLILIFNQINSGGKAESKSSGSNQSYKIEQLEAQIDSIGKELESERDTSETFRNQIKEEQRKFESLRKEKDEAVIKYRTAQKKISSLEYQVSQLEKKTSELKPIAKPLNEITVILSNSKLNTERTISIKKQLNSMGARVILLLGDFNFSASEVDSEEPLGLTAYNPGIIYFQGGYSLEAAVEIHKNFTNFGFHKLEPMTRKYRRANIYMNLKKIRSP